MLRPGPWLVLAVALGVAAIPAGAPLAASAVSGGFRATAVRIPVLDGPGHDQRLSIDATVFVPVGAGPAHPVPAVIGAHGFGGDKEELRAMASALASRGYEVLLYSARGFGRTGGAIGLDGPDYDVADIHQLVDWLAARPEVVADGPGDPRVGMVGVSYGAGAALLAAGHDPRIDAVVPIVGWNSLVTAFDPGDVFKQQWASVFFGTPPGTPEVCPPFVAPVCAAYEATAASGRLTPEARAVLSRSSPSGVVPAIRAPTLLVQGEIDTLFPLNEAASTAAALRAGGVPVKMMWINGGHSSSSAPLTGGAHVQAAAERWLDRWLKKDGRVDTGAAFEWQGSHGRWTSEPGLPPATGRVLSLAPNGKLAAPGPGGPGPGGSGPGGSGPEAGAPGSEPVAMANPAGGQPAALSSLPVASALAGVFAGLNAYDLPGQSAAFESAPLGHGIDVVGLPHLRLSVSASTGEAVLFAKVYDVAPDGVSVLPGRAVAPIRITGPPETPTVADLDLAGMAHHFAAGHRVRLVLSATDQGYANLRQPEHYLVGTGPGLTLGLPLAHPGPSGRRGAGGAAAVAAVLLVVVVGSAAYRWSRRDRPGSGSVGPVLPAAAAPLVIDDLSKRFKGDVLAVDRLTLRVERGQVFGLLGPNGAGKTTTLRMATGLIHPSTGRTLVFGEEVRPGHPVLGHVGIMIEGPGFVPHLSGLDNLRYWWESGRRPIEEAGLEAALEVADLGAALHRAVRTYSHGMKQRLAMAQALLGRPPLLILDEPTDGLDPQQIREVRELLVRLAAEGRTIVLSSHLLAEVEQVCTHVAVMDRGRLIAAGPVADITGVDRQAYFEVSDARLGRRVLSHVLGSGAVERDESHPEGRGLVVSLDGRSRAELVEILIGAGVGVQTVTGRRRLEDAFLGLLEEGR